MGRFVTQDSSPGVREDPQSFDRYVYARDNPLKIVDPNGHDWWSGLVSAATSFASAVTNTWNSLPPPVQTGIIVGGLIGIGLATGGLGDAVALAGAGDYLGAVSVGLFGGGSAIGSALDSVVGDAATSDVVEAGLTNDESTWTNLVPATFREQDFFDRKWVPALSDAYVFEKEGGETQVTLSFDNPYEGQFRTRVDNLAPGGRMSEDKVSAVPGTQQQLSQLSDYTSLLDENPGSALNYNFFLSPTYGRVGPGRVFADALANAMIRHNIGFHIYDHAWWEELQ